jgi:hypothetical protein
MRRFLTTSFIVLVMLAPFPPLFTRGACTAEFEQASSGLEQLRNEVLTLSDAVAYLSSHQIPYSSVSPERCERSPPRDVQLCPGGPILVIKVPVRNLVCRYYRDAAIRQQLSFDRRDHLVHLQTDMNPFHFAKLPVLNIEVDWGK